MTRRKKVSVKEDEVELSRVRLWLPSNFSYMRTKLQLVGGCSVVMNKLDIYKIRTRLRTTYASPEYEPSVFLTPQQTPTSLFSDDSSDLKDDPLHWLDSFDNLTQLLIGSLMTRQYVLFSKTLNAQIYLIEAKHLVLVTEVLGTFPCSELMNCLEITLENEPCSEVKNALKSIILELIFHEVRKSDAFENKCIQLISLADRYKLNLLKKMSILNPNIKKMPVVLLIIEFLLIRHKIDDAVYILSNNKVIKKFLQNNYVLDNELWMFGVTLLHTFRVIYQMKLPLLAYQLAIMNLTQNILPPGVEIWGSLALITILDESDVNVINLRHLFKKLIKSEIDVPINLQRAVIIELSRKQYKHVDHYFLMAPIYSCFTECLPATGPIKCKLEVRMMSMWTTEEMRLAVTWFNDTIQAKKTNQDAKCKVFFMNDILENNVVDDGVDGVNAHISEQYFLHSEKNAKKRLKKIIDSFQSEIAFTFE